MNTDPSLAVKVAYPAPTVKEAPAGVLLPGAVTNRVTIVSPTLTDLPPGAKIEIAFVFGTYLSAPVPYVAGKSFAFPAKELGIYLGTHVLVGYDLTIDGVTTPSERMDLYVMAFDDGDALLPTSIIVEASDRVLDLNPIKVDPTATCPAWKLGAEGQRAWWEVHGTLEDGTADVIVLYSEHAVTDDEVSGGLTKAVDLGRLKELKDGSTITVTLEVTFDMSGDRTRATRFPMQTYKILTKQPDEFVFDPSPHTMDVGTTYSRTARGGKTPYTYTSSNTAAATVNASGNVTAINAGTATITARDSANPQHTGSYVLTTIGALKISVSPSSVLVGDAFSATATGGRKPYTFSVSPPNLATIGTDGTNGRALVAGVSTIKVTDAASHTATSGLTISAPEPWLDDLTTFNSLTWEGWNSGPGARNGKIGYISQLARNGFWTSTDGGGNFSGVIMSKSFPTVVGRTYAISLLGYTGKVNPPEILVSAGSQTVHQMKMNGVTNFNPKNFVAQSTATLVSIKNLEATGNGNDFGLTNIRIQRIA